VRSLIVVVMVAVPQAMPSCFGGSAPPPARARVDFALAFAAPQPQTVAVSVPNDGTFYAQREPVLTERDIESAVAFRSEGKLVLGVQFGREGASRLQRVSAANVGNRLVMSLDSAPILALQIAAPVTNGAVTLEIHQHTEEELRALASRMRGW
jgi:preprotein translocase subunit SecD